MSTAKKNDTVKVHYTGTLTDGEVFDSSRDREPLEFVVGVGQMIAGFDAAVEGMELDERKEVTILAAGAYGERNENLIQEVPRIHLPADMKPEIGQTLVATGDQGQQMHVVVTSLENDHIVVDGNHPLAGKDLIFDIELVEIA